MKKLKKNMITEEEFWVAYNNHLPNGWIKFAYRYFSNETLNKDIVLNNVILYILIGLFGIGFIGTMVGIPRSIIGTVTIAYSIILASLVLYLFSAVKLNNIRINKIRKELGGISADEYNKLVEMYSK